MPATSEPLPCDAVRSNERICVACGYNLFGLGDEPRCPECGLLNVPDGLRRQVWELVDSGKWFFSGFFSPLKRRPYGWWWSLDRPGDVKRGIRFAAWCIAVAVTIVAVFSCVGASWTADRTTTWTFVDVNDPSQTVQTLRSFTERYAFDRTTTTWSTHDGAPWHDLGQNVASASRSARLTFTPSFNCLGIFFPVVVALLLVWVMPAQVGLWTQIRKGLPSFARAPRTIIVASCLEAHRLIYLSVLYAMWVLADMWVRTWILPWNDRCIPYMIVGLVCFGAIGWVGPLRSDYTRQLVRSRIHALRILAMYAVLLPSLVALTTQFVMRMRTVWAMY